MFNFSENAYYLLATKHNIDIYFPDFNHIMRIRRPINVSVKSNLVNYGFFKRQILKVVVATELCRSFLSNLASYPDSQLGSSYARLSRQSPIQGRKFSCMEVARKVRMCKNSKFSPTFFIFSSSRCFLLHHLLWFICLQAYLEKR